MGWNVGGITFPHAPIMVGAGACKRPEKAMEWLKAIPVVSGSHTPEPRAGNPGVQLQDPDTCEEFLDRGYAGNYYGMPNVGVKRATRAFADYRGDNPHIASVAAFSVADYIRHIEKMLDCRGVNGVEGNFGCPNTEGGGRIMSFQPQALQTFFSSEQSSEKPLWAKFSPYSDPGQLCETAEICNAAVRRPRAVVICNTFPNAYFGKGITSPDGLAGLSGPHLKPIVLGQVMQFRKWLRDDIDVIACGGIVTGNDVMDFLEVGAAGVQLTSLPSYLQNPAQVWEALLNEKTGSRLLRYLEECAS